MSNGFHAAPDVPPETLTPSLYAEETDYWMSAYDPTQWFQPDAFYDIHDQHPLLEPPPTIDPMAPRDPGLVPPRPAGTRPPPVFPATPPPAGAPPVPWALPPVEAPSPDGPGGEAPPPIRLPAYPYAPPEDHALFGVEGQPYPMPMPWPPPEHRVPPPAQEAPIRLSPYDLMPVSQSFSIKDCGCGGGPKEGCGCGG